MKRIICIMMAFAAFQAFSQDNAATESPQGYNLQWRSGLIDIGDGLASLNLNEDFRFLDPADTKTVLVDIWGNPPGGSDYLGMLFPANTDPAEQSSWGVVISFEEDGHVEDDDAQDINYNELLETMQEATRANNASRQELGYDPVELLNWAEPPHYDVVNKKLYWAKELKIGDYPTHTLNYDIRVLGRKGVLVLTAVAGVDQLAQIKPGMESIVAFTEFNEGHRYADFNPKVDKVAAYGIAGLIAGKVAAKAGLFKGLIAILIAAKKFLLLGLVAIGGLLKKIFGGRKEEEAEA